MAAAAEAANAAAAATAEAAVTAGGAEPLLARATATATEAANAAPAGEASAKLKDFVQGEATGPPRPRRSNRRRHRWHRPVSSGG